MYKIPLKTLDEIYTHLLSLRKELISESSIKNNEELIKLLELNYFLEAEE
jgi:hypothetical protein